MKHLLFLKVLVFFVCSSAFAATVIPIPPYNFQNGTVYYYATNLSLTQDIDPTTHPAVMPTSPSFLDTGEGYKGINVYSVTGTENAIFFEIKTTQTYTVNAGQHLAVSVMAKDTSAAYNIIPIHYAQATTGTPAACTASTCNKTTDMTDGGYREAWITSGTAHRIGIFLKSLCNTESASEGCDLSEPVKFNLRIVVWVTDDANNTQTYSTGGETFDATVQLHQATSSITCPVSDVAFAETYFPGDGEIYLNPSKFGMSQVTNGAPKETLMAVAKLSPDLPIRSYLYASSNNVVSKASATASQMTIGRFTNKSSTAENLYNIGFMMRDASGVAVLSNDSCVYGGVQTSTIQSFLNSSKCFVSTLAYGSEEHFFVKTLKAFRDRVLLKTSLGTGFTRSYYRNSPKLVAVLSQHGWSRPVLQLMLLPVVVNAWFLVNPVSIAVLVLSFYLAYRYRRKLCGIN